MKHATLTDAAAALCRDAGIEPDGSNLRVLGRAISMMLRADGCRGSDEFDLSERAMGGAVAK